MRKHRSKLRSLGVALLALIAALPPLPAAAATFRNLYTLNVAPDSTETDQRSAALKAAMATLLVRVTGRRDAALDPALQPLVDQASTYLNSYGLLKSGEVQVGFNASRVASALTALNQPVWGDERPLTLIWVAVDDGNGSRALLGANGADNPDLQPAVTDLLAMIRAELAKVADERGLPLALPLLDLEDLNAVSFADLWGGFEDRIALASARYRADAVLVGRIRPGPEGVDVQWLLLEEGERRELAGAALRDGLDAVADRAAAELAVVGGATAIRLAILDVASFADYGRVMSYLETLSVLQTVDVDSFDHGTLNLKVAARGDSRVLERVLALGGVLRSAAAPTEGSGAPAQLVFRLARTDQ